MLTFTPSTPLTLGVELELQIVNRRDYDLTRGWWRAKARPLAKSSRKSPKA